MTESVGPTPEERRLSFGSAAGAYHRYRPGYPAAALRFVLGKARLRVLDLGAGTGRLTERLVELGHDVVAVEPDPEMLGVLNNSLTVESHRGTAEEIPLPDGSVDAVTVGQAFHWFERERALPEIARVLRPAGVLGLLWNVLDDRIDWIASICDITTAHARLSLIDDEPDPALAPWFTPPVSRQFTQNHGGSLEELIGEVSTWSYVSLHADRDQLIDAVRTSVTAQKSDGDYSVPYVTSTFRAVRA